MLPCPASSLLLENGVLDIEFHLEIIFLGSSQRIGIESEYEQHITNTVTATFSNLTTVRRLSVWLVVATVANVKSYVMELVMVKFHENRCKNLCVPFLVIVKILL